MRAVSLSQPAIDCIRYMRRRIAWGYSRHQTHSERTPSQSRDDLLFGYEAATLRL
jgi:hypothetical protein